MGIIVFDIELFIGGRVQEIKYWPLRHVTQTCNTVGWSNALG